MEKNINVGKILNGKYSWISNLPLDKIKQLTDEEIANDEADYLAGLHKNKINPELFKNKKFTSILDDNPNTFFKLNRTFQNKDLVDEKGNINYRLLKDEELVGINNPTKLGIKVGKGNLNIKTVTPETTEINTDVSKEKTQQSIYDKIASDTEREKTFGLLGYGIQGVSALKDLHENMSQSYSQPPNDVYNKRIEYKPVDIEPYLNKMQQSEAAYLKYLKETGNGNLIPSLMSYGSQKNELASKLTEGNNQKEIAVAGANAQSDFQAMQLNQQLRSDYNKQKFAEMQYKDAAIKSNKSAIFGSIAGMLSTGAGATNKEIKLDAYKKLIEAGEYAQAAKLFQQYTND